MRKDALMVFLALLEVIYVFPIDAAMGAEAPRMGKDELKTKLENSDVVIIDVRSYTDWLLSGDKIKGAVRENYRDFEGWSARYPKDKTIVLYCA
jgi:predicted sulfurtransferase